MRREIYRPGTVSAALIIAALAGCAETQPQVRAAPPAIAWQEPPRPPPPEPVELARYTLAYPTGDRSTSTLLVEKIVPERVRLGERYAYTIRVTNLTDEALTNVIVNETAAGLDIEPPREAGPQPQPGQWVIGTLPARSTKTIEAHAIARQAGERTSCLGVDFTPAKPTMCSAVNVVEPGTAALRVLTYDTQDPIRVGDVTTYEVSVTNQGDGPARNVDVNTVIPPTMTLVDVVGPSRGVPRGEYLQLGPIDLDPGATARWRIQVRADQPGTARFRTEVDSEFLDRPVPDEEPTRIIEPQA